MAVGGQQPPPPPPSAEPVLISAAVNTNSQCLAWAQTRQQEDGDEVAVAYGAHRWVALATAQGEVRHALRGHLGAVQCVEWLRVGREVASGSADGTVRVWSRGEEGEEERWRCAHVLRPWSGGQQQQEQKQPPLPSTPPPPVSRLAAVGLAEEGRGGVFLAAAITGGVTVWHRGAGAAGVWEVAFFTPLPAVQMPTALALTPLGQEAWALWVGAVDARIHVWTGTFARPGSGSTTERGGAGPAMEWRRMGALLGHQGWIRSLAWRPLEEEEGERGQGLWVASGSQDGKIRLWKAEPLEEAAAAGAGANAESGSVGIVAEREEESEGVEGGGAEEEDDHEVRLVLEAAAAAGQKPRRFGVRLDALLVGHEDWVTGVCWHPPRGEGSAWPLALLSCSMDRSLIIWRPEGARGVWTPRVRLGDLGADLGGAVGSNLLGFLGCAFDAQGTTVLGHGFGGSMHAYRLEDDGVGAGVEDGGVWRPVPFATGHFEEASDVQWERWRGDAEEGSGSGSGSGTGAGLGRYLVSASKDQTTRMWAPLVGPKRRWHEVSRVQVHGYDLACVDLLPHVAYRLVSGADEKTLRVFDATANVLTLLQGLCGLAPPRAEAQGQQQGHRQGARVETAYMQALALSTKAVLVAAPALPNDDDNGDESGNGDDEHGDRRPASACGAWASAPAAGDKEQDAAALDRVGARTSSWTGRGPPLEGELVGQTLWPEVGKLYGHGNELTCMAADHGGRLVASACKARDPETARVRLWETATWRPLAGCASLPGHQSTVVQLAFSHDDTCLASVSKDRQVCLYLRDDEQPLPQSQETETETETEVEARPAAGHGYRLAQTLTKAHRRIIWSCSWAHDDSLFATGSRDGTFKLWRRRCAQPEQPGGGQRDVRSAVLSPEPLATLRPAAAGGSGPAVGESGAGSGGGADSVTAVAFAPRLASDGQYLLAVGLDSGDVELWAGGKEESAPWACRLRFAGSLPHAATVKRLRWRPLAGTADGGPSLELASCGADHAVKVARIVGL